ncbi:MAG: RluA family pseudouridine synthase [Deltaproteobacteria bacterium]|nr:RluA family pseudouridine synthase [Deltaproteobacteria bacterium]
MERLEVKESQDLKRLDIVLSSHGKIGSRSMAQRLIRQGKVQLNQSSENLTPKRIMRKGDLITFNLEREYDSEIKAIRFPLDIVYEDESLIVLNKPRGMVVHPSFGHRDDTLVNYLLYHCALSSVYESRPGIVHRIDKDTSGLLVVAKDDLAHIDLARQFFDHSITREYQALAWGTFNQPKGLIDKPLGRHPVNRKKRSVVSSGKRALTHYRVLEDFKIISLVQCGLETGRTHQIRVHLSSLGHPIVGDALYGSFRNDGQRLKDPLKEKVKALKGQALHAKSLGFVHPKTKQKLEFESQLPADFDEILSGLREVSA